MTTTNAELIAEARAIVRAVCDGSSFDGRPAWLVIQDLADALESATTVTDEMVERFSSVCDQHLWNPYSNLCGCGEEFLPLPGGLMAHRAHQRRAALTAALTEGERR